MCSGHQEAAKGPHQSYLPSPWLLLPGFCSSGPQMAPHSVFQRLKEHLPMSKHWEVFMTPGQCEDS